MSNAAAHRAERVSARHAATSAGSAAWCGKENAGSTGACFEQGVKRSALRAFLLPLFLVLFTLFRLVLLALLLLLGRPAFRRAFGRSGFSPRRYNRYRVVLRVLRRSPRRGRLGYRGRYVRIGRGRRYLRCGLNRRSRLHGRCGLHRVRLALLIAAIERLP